MSPRNNGILTKPLTRAEIIKTFGDPSPYLRDNGEISSGWPSSILTMINLPGPLPLSWDHNHLVYRISCHKLISAQLLKALTEIHALPDVWSTINDYAGCYNFRLQRKSKDKLSAHAWGIAIDLDVADNPFGHSPTVHPKTKQIFSDNGFIWGGIFGPGRVDGMHFEFADLDLLKPKDLPV